MAAIPFTLQDVKSEHGGTPPPASSSSSRIPYDVTRAFQQVPTPSSSSSTVIAQPSSSSPNAANRLTRQPSYGFPSPSVANGSRPLYPVYAAPNMGTPSPGMMYPVTMAQSPLARPVPMNGHSPQHQPQYQPQPQPQVQPQHQAQPQQQYQVAQQYPMWVPVHHTGAPGSPMAPVHYMHNPYAPAPQGMVYASTPPAGMYQGMYAAPPPVTHAHAQVAPIPQPQPQHQHQPPAPQARGRGVPPPVVTQPAPGAYGPHAHQPYPSPITPGGRGHAGPSGSHGMSSPRAPPAHPSAFGYVRGPW
jgi:serine/arginine repetitive matrix protein 2